MKRHADMSDEEIDKLVDKVMDSLGEKSEPLEDKEPDAPKEKPDDTDTEDTEDTIEEIDKAFAEEEKSKKKAARGQQTKRKDKDLMTDTNGPSYQKKEPRKKPPRIDVKKPYSPKNKKPEDYDPDIDQDPDLKPAK